MSIVQWILPAVSCAARDGAGSLRLEFRIQKSRTPRKTNTIGIWNNQTNYAIGNVVYYNGIAYPGWQAIQVSGPATTAITPGTNAAYWIPASNFDFVQSDLSTVFYLDQQIISDLGQLTRSASRQQGLITPDSRSIKFIDFTHYSGTDGNGSVTPWTDLSATPARTLLNLIFDDPDAYYTLFGSRWTGTGYSTNRELYCIGDIDLAKMSATYALDYMPGTSLAIQKLTSSVQAEAVGNRLNSFSVKDLILSIAQTDVDAFGNEVPFIGGLALLGGGPPPTFPQNANRFFESGSPVLSFSALFPKPIFPDVFRYAQSRANSRQTSQGICKDNSTQWGQQNQLIVATTSINDRLHFIKLTTILSKMAALANYTDGGNATNLTFWTDYIYGPTQVLTAQLDLSEVGFCYEYLFNIDFRCDFGAIQEMSMANGFAWNATLGDVLKKIAHSLVTYARSTYDQTHYIASHALADSVQNSGSALPLKWEADSAKAGIKPRVQSALHVEVNNTGDSDKLSCKAPGGPAGNPLNVEMGWRVRKQGELNQGYGDATVDIIYNSKLQAADQWTTFQPMTGGLLDGGHVIGRGWDSVSKVEVWTGSTGSFVRYGSDHYGVALTDNSREFVLTQDKNGSYWTGLQNDIYGNGANYLVPQTTDGNSDSVCFWCDNGFSANRCIYAAIARKESRNQLSLTFPYGGQNGTVHGITSGGSEPTTPLTPAYYVIGYGGFGMDLTVTDGQATISSQSYDFYNNDIFGNGHVGQQIIIPQRGVFVIKSVSRGSGGSGFDPSKNHITLDRPVIGSGTNLEFRIGGPKINPQSFVVGSYFYWFNFDNSVPYWQRFAPTYYSDDIQDAGLSYPSEFLNSGGATSNCWVGCYAISRLRYNDGTSFNPSTDFPDDSYGNSLKTFAQCQAAINLGSLQLVSRVFGGVLSDPTATPANSLLGYGPLDTYLEHSQGSLHTYAAQTMRIDERHGTVEVDLLDFTNAPIIDDAHFPVTTAGGSSSGSSGTSGGSIGGTSAGGGGTMAATWRPDALQTLTGIGSVAIPLSYNDCLVIIQTGVTSVTAPPSTAPNTMVLSNQSGSALTTGDFHIPNGDTWLVVYDGTAWRIVSKTFTLPADIVITDPAATQTIQATNNTTVDVQFKQFSGSTQDLWQAATSTGTINAGLDHNFILYSLGALFSGVVNMAGNQINNVATPTLSGDAATKGYVDGKFPGTGSFVWTQPANAGESTVAPQSDFTAFTINHVASPTTNIQLWQVNGTTLARIDPSGNFIGQQGSFSSSGTTNTLSLSSSSATTTSINVSTSATGTTPVVAITSGGGNLFTISGNKSANFASSNNVATLASAFTAQQLQQDARTVSANTTLDGTYANVDVDTSGGSKTITLPSHTSAQGACYTIAKAAAANTVTVTESGGGTLKAWTTSGEAHNFIAMANAWRVE